MATVTGLTASRMLAIEASSVVSGHVDAEGKLILTTDGGTVIDAGSVKGDKGEPGVNAYVFTQPVPASVWTITHPLNYKPAVTIIDSAGSVVHGDVSYSGQTITVAFSAGFSGSAYLS